MSRQVCETCDWFVTGGFVGEDGYYGICTYMANATPSFAARYSFMSPNEAAEQIRFEEDWCKNWQREEGDGRA